MSKSKYEHLFEPIKIGNVVFNNRLFATPEGYYDISNEYFPDNRCQAFFERKARGGWASVSIGDCIVDSELGKHYQQEFNIEAPNARPRFVALASSIRRHGVVPCMELTHAGMFAQAIAEWGRPIYGPSECVGPYGPVLEMSEEMIEHTIKKYAEAAQFAVACGFKIICIHGGHGWLPAQFFSPLTNHRTDRWGGSLENRLRFPLAVVEAVRKVVGPKFPIEYRFSGEECVEGGYDLADGVEYGKALDDKVDIIHVSAGHHEVPQGTIVTHPSMFDLDARNAYMAKEIKKHVKTPVLTVGAMTTPEIMEEILAKGEADIIGVGRQTLADPDLPLKLRTGREDELINCLRCYNCFNNSFTRQFHCSVNPQMGFDLESMFGNSACEKKKVLVVGGGIAGMQAALTASKQGHDVILCEKGPRLGGALLCEEHVPFKKQLDRYINTQRHLCEKARIDIRLNTEVTPEYAESLDVDEIICALGARPAKPPIKGIDGPNVYGAEYVYYHPDAPGKHITILGAGLVGIELGIYMSMLGHQVRLVEMLDHMAVVNPSMHTIALTEQIKKYNIEVMLSTACQEIHEDGSLTVKTADGQIQKLESDTVIYATGQRPLADEAIALTQCAPVVRMIGDCIAPKNMVEANQMGYATAMDVGRIF